MSDKDDLISRRVAIETIDEWVKKAVHPQNMSAYEYDSAYEQGEIDAYVTEIDTVKTLPAAQPETQWIPVSERRPEIYGAYLVQDVNGGIFVDYWRGYWLAKTTMVAWRELPEPYKGGRCDRVSDKDDLTKEMVEKQAALDAIMGQPPEPHYPSWYAAQIEKLPAAQPKTTMTIERTKGEITMWYECDNCGEPVDQSDNYCWNCGRRFKKDSEALEQDEDDDE